MAATGTPSRAGATSARTAAGRAPACRARLDASWITPPSITGSEKGMPTSIASAPACSSPRRSSASTPGSPPVTQGTNARPPPSRRARMAVSRSATGADPSLAAEEAPHGVQVLVTPPRQVDQHELPLGERPGKEPADRVSGLERGQDPFLARQSLEPRERLGIGR